MVEWQTRRCSGVVFSVGEDLMEVAFDQDPSKDQLEYLQRDDHVPLCSGAISPPPEGSYLYYGQHSPKYVSAFLDFAQRSN